METQVDPLVSVIVTVFRRTEYIDAALRSVLTQDAPCRLEIIVADDSNTPAIRDVVEALADERLRYRPSIPHLGLARMLADALTQCRGDFVAILNDDDLWEPGFLGALLPPLLADQNAVLAFSDHWIMDETGAVDVAASDANSREWGRADLSPGQVAEPGRVAVLAKAIPIVMGSLFRRDAISPGAIAAEVGGACDYWLAILLAATGRPLLYVPARTTRYRVHRQMETVRPNPDKRQDELFILAEIVRHGWFAEVAPAIRARLRDVACSVAINKMRFRRRAEARAVAMQGVRAAPGLKILAVLAASYSPVLPHRLMFGEVTGRAP